MKKLTFLPIVAFFALALIISGCGNQDSVGPVQSADKISAGPSQVTSQTPTLGMKDLPISPKGSNVTTHFSTGPGVVTYNFDDLTPACVWDNLLSSTYQDLTFIDAPYLAVCSEPYAPYPYTAQALIPANSNGGVYDLTIPMEIRIQLPNPATSVSISSYIYNPYYTSFKPILIAYDASGTAIGSASNSTDGTWETLTVTAPSGSAIDRIGLKAAQANNYWNDLVVEYITTIQVSVDIKPGDGPNSINLKSKGVIPVAVLTTGSFDAATVDGSTVLFAGASPDHGGGHLEDVDGDGDLDWLGHFRTQNTTLDENSTEATLTGQTTGGQDIEGSDSVQITPGSSKGKK